MEVKDLRTSLELLKKMEGQLVETDIEVDPAAELDRPACKQGKSCGTFGMQKGRAW